MSKAAVSIFVFGWYIFANAIILILAPNMMLSTLGLAPTKEPWLRLLGIMTLALSFYYLLAAREKVLPFFRWTILGRATVFVGVTALAIAGLVPAVIVSFAVIDGAGAMWTAAALRAERTARPAG
jgi:hypothetical protein